MDIHTNAPTDAQPGRGLSIGVCNRGGHHRLSEIAKRVRSGLIDPSTMIEIAID